MVLPVNVDTATVTGVYVKLDGTPCSGTVTFTPVPTQLLDAGADPPTNIRGTPIAVVLDEFGSFEVDLPATDDEDLNPVDWAYHVSVRLGDYAADSFCMNAAAGTTVDLTTVTPITDSSGNGVVAGGPGPAGEGVPTGGESGEVLAKASGDDFDTAWVPASAPGVHASTHAAGSTDPVTLTQAQVTGLVSALAAKQPLDSDLTTIAALSPGSDAVIQRKVGMWVASTPTEYKEDLDLDSADVGLGNVNNTSDAAKPVSTATQTALNLKANLSLLVGGTTGQVFAKNSDTNYDVEWIDAPTGGGGGDVPSARTISTTAPLTGGGDLSANRTLAITAFAGSTAGAVPTSSGGETTFLRADGTWAVPAGGGAISSHVTYSYNATTSEPPTGNQIRMNSTTQTAVTRLWISQTTVDGLDVSLGLARIAAGHYIYIQDRDDATKWVKYVVSALGTDDGSYYDFTVVYFSGPADVPTGQVELQSLAPAADGFGAEDAVDAVGLALTEGAGIDIVYDDSANTITLTVDKTEIALGNVDNTADTAKPVSTATQTALDLKADKAYTINAQTGTTYTLVLTDAAKLVTLSNASAITCTVPLNSSVAYPTGTTIDLAQLGAGQVTVAATGGVTVNATPTLKLRAQYAAASLIKYATDTWLLVGDFERNMTALGIVASGHAETSAASAITIASPAQSAFTGAAWWSFTFPSPWTPTTGDVIVYWSAKGANTTFAGGTGWTEITQGRPSGNQNVQGCLYHIVTSGEASAVTRAYQTPDPVWGANASGASCGIVLRGVNTAAVVDSFGVASALSGPPHPLAGLTGSNLSTGSFVLSCVNNDNTHATAYPTPTGWTAQTQINSGVRMALFSKDSPTTAGVNIASESLSGPQYESVSITVAFTSL